MRAHIRTLRDARAKGEAVAAVVQVCSIELQWTNGSPAHRFGDVENATWRRTWACPRHLHSDLFVIVKVAGSLPALSARSYIDLIPERVSSVHKTITSAKCTAHTSCWYTQFYLCITVVMGFRTRNRDECMIFMLLRSAQSSLSSVCGVCSLRSRVFGKRQPTTTSSAQQHNIYVYIFSLPKHLHNYTAAAFREDDEMFFLLFLSLLVSRLDFCADSRTWR